MPSRFPVAVLTALALGACAEGPQSAPPGPTIIWDSERQTAPAPATGPAPVETAPAPQGTLTPPPADGCREYTQTVTIDGRPQQAYGWACPQPDGTWRLTPAAPRPAPRAEAREPYPVPVYPPYPRYGPPVYFGGSFFFSERYRHRPYGPWGYPRYR